MQQLRLIVYSDYLCPWCYNGTVRLRRIRQEYGEQVSLQWRSFLLRPEPSPSRNLEKFRAYTQSWLRPAAEPDSGRFRVWRSDAGPPSHSVPPHLLAKAAATLGSDAFDAMHEHLMEAYFADNRDITDTDVQRELWSEVGLSAEAFERVLDPALLQATLREHQEALDAGVTGVPAARIEGREGLILGAYPIELYQRWIRRALEEAP
jgi:predicted DsbA family dithiol-disulfide isomerase